MARALEPARASSQAPPPGKGAVSGGEEVEVEVEVGDGDGASATGLAEIVDACFSCFCFNVLERVSD